MFLDAITSVFQPDILLYLILGVGSGIIIGALPGLTATMAVALILPLTFGMNAAGAMLLLIGVYKGAIYGGAIPAILLRTPGTPASAAAVQDGYAFSERGESGRALGIATVASFIGGIISVIVVILVAPQLATFALRFSAPEFFLLALFGLSIISTVSGGNMLKGVLVGLLGVFLSTIGIDAITGVSRFTFGNINLLNGVQFIPAMIGLFALSEVLTNIESMTGTPMTRQKVTKVIPNWTDMKAIFKTSGVAGLIGTFIGIIPGAGADIAAFVSYNFAKQTSKTPEKFGTGVTEGIASAEAGNNGLTGGALIPMLTLGIPGDAVTAILIGALTIQGLQPGPLLFTEHRTLMYTIFVGMILANIFMLLLGLSSLKLFSRVLSIPKSVLTPIIFILCIVGSFAINMNFFDVGIMMVFGVLGYLMKKLDFPIAPMVLGMILGPMAESNFRRALIMSSGSYSVFFASPISIAFILMTIISFVLPILRNAREKRAALAGGPATFVDEQGEVETDQFDN